MNITVTRAAIPPCCANCQFNDWNEDGPHCVHPAHWDVEDAEIDEESGKIAYYGDEQTGGGDIEWDNVCEHHLPGTHSQLSREVFNALCDQRRAEFKTILEAQAAAM